MTKLQKREQHIPHVNQNDHGGIKEQQEERRTQRDELTDSSVFWYTPRSGGHGLVIIIEGAVTMHGRYEGLANDVNGLRSKHRWPSFVMSCLAMTS